MTLPTSPQLPGFAPPRSAKPRPASRVPGLPAHLASPQLMGSAPPGSKAAGASPLISLHLVESSCRGSGRTVTDPAVIRYLAVDEDRRPINIRERHGLGRGDDYRPAVEGLFDLFPDQVLGKAVDVRKGVVEQEYSGVFSGERPGQGEPLFLASDSVTPRSPTTVSTPCSYLSISPRHMGHRDQPLQVGGDRPVLPDRCGIKEGILRHQPDPLPQRGKRDPANVGPIERIEPV